MSRPSRTSFYSAWLAAGLALLAAASVLAQPPAALPSAGEDSARASFQRFAESWMAAARRREAGWRREPTVRPGARQPLVTYRGYGDDLRTELQATGHAGVPYLGIVRYTEYIYSCSDVQAVHCSIASSIPVTEIFRFRDGRWVY